MLYSDRQLSEYMVGYATKVVNYSTTILKVLEMVFIEPGKLYQPLPNQLTIGTSYSTVT